MLSVKDLRAGYGGKPVLQGATLAVDNNDRITAKAVLTNAEHMVLAMMENGK